MKSHTARYQRKPETPVAAILPARNRPVCPFASATRPGRAALESTPQKNLMLRNSREETASQCCVDHLSRQHLPEMWIFAKAVVWSRGDLQLLKTTRELSGLSPISLFAVASCARLQLNPLPSTGVIRLRQYYEPLRHLSQPGLSLAS